MYRPVVDADVLPRRSQSAVVVWGDGLGIDGWLCVDPRGALEQPAGQLPWRDYPSCRVSNTCLYLGFRAVLADLEEGRIR